VTARGFLLLIALASLGPATPAMATDAPPAAASPATGADARAATTPSSPAAAPPAPAADPGSAVESRPQAPSANPLPKPLANPPAPPPLLAAPILEPRRPGTALFYFFSPDWRPPDLSKLTFAVEQALASADVHVSFQAFTRYEDFERQVRAQPPTFMIAPAWLEGPAAGSFGASFTVIARPVRHGRHHYRKALMTRSNADSIDDLARGSIAATLHSMGSGDPAAVLDAFHLAAGSARIVPVPKDIDALLALSFGQVDAALVTSEQYEQLARTSPAEAERLRVLAFSSEVGLPPVFASTAADAAGRAALLSVLSRLQEVPNGADVLAMLGFDGFVSEERLAAEREAEADKAAAGEASAAAAASAAADAETKAAQAKAASAKTNTAGTKTSAAGNAAGAKTSEAKPQKPPKSKPVAKPARPAKKTGSASGRRN
jgi:hypothetical protein